MSGDGGYRSGFAAILGRPNVGKSTLLNALVGEKVAIVSDKPQTTRSRVLGVMSMPGGQIVFLDTPGLTQARNKLGEYMQSAAYDSLTGADAIVIVAACGAVGPKDRAIIEKFAKRKLPKILVLNKTDCAPRETIARDLQSFNAPPYDQYDAVLPLSAMTGDGVDTLRGLLFERMPEGPRYFPDDMITDQPEYMLCAELIREKALARLREEVPHGIGVEVQRVEKISSGLTEIHANIYVERAAHKGIVLGKHGRMLQAIGTQARLDIEKLLATHVSLQLWVKVREDWRNRADDLRTLGYARERG
ncbi:MAG: GTPase Era [Oscillospiraceae bacterium]|jgi:GTP-binding protein Era|nr:GTPase Era [Oscillospiraceae bacterium]